MNRAMQRFMTFTFVAAQRLTCVDQSHKAARLHGHTFDLQVFVDGAPDPVTGQIIDPIELKATVDTVLAGVDHQYLNELPGFENPSTEFLCCHLADQLAPRVPGLARVSLFENRDVGCVIDLEPKWAPPEAIS